MKVAPLLGAALVIYIAIPGSNQGKVLIYKVYKAMESSCYSKYTKISPYPAASSKSLSECQTMCTNNPECGAILMWKASVESGGSTSCYMIKPNNLFNEGTCTWGSGSYNVYEKKFTVLIYKVYKAMESSCYSKYTKISPYPAASSKSLSECQTICTNNPECGAILMWKASVESGGSTSCYMIKPNNLFNEGTCTWGSGSYNVYEKKFTASIEQLVAKITQLEDALANTQGTVAKMESCLADSSSADCPPPASGKTSMAGRISANAAALADKCDASTCSNIQEEIAKFHPKRLNLVLIGGWDKFAGKSSEVISPTGVCKSTIPPLPFSAYDMEAVYFDNQIMLCGGFSKSTNTVRKSCSFLRNSASQWEEGPEMNVERQYFQLVKAKDAVFAIGGQLSNNNGAIERTIEKYYRGKWTLLNQMPTARYESCAIYWEAIDSLVVIGGFGTDKVEAFNIQLEQWSDLPSLPYELRLHNCALLNETIYVIAGAYHSGEHGDRTVLKYTMGAKAWEKSKPINSIRYYHSANVLDGKLLIAGSYNIHDMKKQIERMKDDETWEYMPWILSSERDRHADVEVPEQSFPCL